MAELPRPNHQELHRLLSEFSRFGATETGGISRLAATKADGEARDHLAAILEAAGATIAVDPVGNMFGTVDLAGKDAPTVLAGSHLDSQDGAGRLDGTYGVVAAAVALSALRRSREAGARFAANLCVTNWTSEEGARFQPSLLGSGSYAGAFAADWALGRVDEAGVTLGDALTKIGYRGSGRGPSRALACVEVHVEQGPVLEASGGIGIVTRNWAAVKVEAVFRGMKAHTGPTPMGSRKDALLAAAYAIAAIRDLADRYPSGVLHTSVGRIEVQPNSPNVVPDRVRIYAELRTGAEEIVSELDAELSKLLVAAAEKAGVDVHVDSRSVRGARQLDPALADLVAASATALDLPAHRMDTVAGHDALAVAALCPSVVIFVPSIGAIGHNEAEASMPADLENGADVLTAVLWALCRTGSIAKASALLSGLREPVGS